METLEQPAGDRGVPAPFNEQMMQSALGELSDGARLAVQTCLDLWRDQVSCFECIILHLPSIDSYFFITEIWDQRVHFVH